MSTYRGRFAPSPTGPLHLGSLLAALASWADARSAGGRWLVRIEDLDPPREQPGASAAILDVLTAINLGGDEPVVRQSQRHAQYDAALAQLLREGLAFECRCSRGDLQAQGGIHRGPCAPGDPSRAPAIRLRVPDVVITFDDRIQGLQTQRLQRDVGDFVLRRADGLYAYQLAVVVDDAEQGITDVVRGSDLLDSTPRQIYLQQCLHLSTPRYAHLPVLLGPDGQKLSKQNLAPAISPQDAPSQLPRIARWLGQTAVDPAPLEIMLQQFARQWRIEAVPRTLALPAPPRS